MNIQDIREIMGLTQTQVAEELGVPRQEVIDCEENGETYLLLQYISAFPINPQILKDPDADPFLPSFDQGTPGQRLRRWREENRVSEADMAAALDMTQEELRSLEESGDLYLTRRRGEEIEKKTGLNRKWLMYGDGRNKGIPRLSGLPAKNASASRESRLYKPAPNKAAGVQVRDARTAAGLSREALADLLDLSVSRVAQMESGYITDQKASHILHRISAVSSPEASETPRAAGIRVREARKAAGLSVREAAEIISLKSSTLAHMESGYVTPRRADELIAQLQAAAPPDRPGRFDPKAAGQRIREERAEAGLSQKELGTILRLPVTRIAHIELGHVTEKEYKEILLRIHRKPSREVRAIRVKPTDQVILGADIRELRETAGLSQKELGNLLQLPQTRVSLMERGKVDETTAKSILQKLNALIESRQKEAEPSDTRKTGRREPSVSRPHAPEKKQSLRADLGAEIQKKRIAAGLSQKALGDLIGVSQGSVSYMEQGRVNEETAGRVLQEIDNSKK